MCEAVDSLDTFFFTSLNPKLLRVLKGSTQTRGDSPPQEFQRRAGERIELSAAEFVWEEGRIAAVPVELGDFYSKCANDTLHALKPWQLPSAPQTLTLQAIKPQNMRRSPSQQVHIFGETRLEEGWPESIDLPCVDSMHLTLCTRTVCTWTSVCTYKYVQGAQNNHASLLGGSWVVLSGLISMATILILPFR